jgi:xanthine dehydrogenase YagR molybdenum-binding subunit
MQQQAKWPENRRIIGTKVSRLDGPAKATGTARYGYDINRKGQLHAMILRSPHAHARIKSIDTSAAEKMPGFKAIHAVKKAGDELIYAGDEILGIAADTEEHAADAIRAVKIDYDILDHITNEEEALKAEKSTVPGGNAAAPGKRAQGNVDEALKAADAVVEGTYSIAVQTHLCLETHGMVAEWAGSELTVWCSTQAVPGIAGEMEKIFRPRFPDIKTRCITHYMGGGYGSKFNAGVEGRICAELALLAKAPVKLFLDRADEHVAVGNRPSGTAKITIAGTKDGKITAFASDSYGTGGATAGGHAYHTSIPYIYPIPNIRNTGQTVRINAGSQRALRAPGHPQYCYLTESAIDDLCNKLGLDPLQVRLKNLPADQRKPIYEKEIEIAAKLAEWDKKWHPPGKGPGTGPVKHGMGMAIHTWGGGGRPDNDVYVTISSDGSVLVQCSTQDLGTGERTVLAIIAAEVLGLEVKDIRSEIGESQIGRSTGSGGSTTCPGTSPAAFRAALAARDELFKAIADKLGAKAEDLSIEPGQIVDRASKKSFPWKQACARLGMQQVKGQGNHLGKQETLSSVTVGGVQVAEVMVDTETGVVRCTKVIAVQDCGLIINKLGCESQVAGGVIMGLNHALFEDRIMDRHTGRQVNPDMEFYKLGGIEDMPEIIVHMHDMPERGVIGIGEPPVIAPVAAIGNAICNAIGARVPRTPFTPDRVLAALAQKGGA